MISLNACVQQSILTQETGVISEDWSRNLYETALNLFERINMEEILRELPKKAQKKHFENKKFFTQLKKKTPKDLDYLMNDLHEAEFQKNRLPAMRQLLQNNRTLIYQCRCRTYCQTF